MTSSLANLQPSVTVPIHFSSPQGRGLNGRAFRPLSQAKTHMKLSLQSRDCRLNAKAWTGPEGSRRLRFPEYQDSQHIKVSWLSAIRTGRLYTPIKYSWQSYMLIKSILKLANACYYSVQNLLSSTLLSKNLKIKIYRTIILPVVLYGCEAWSLTLREECRLKFCLRIGCWGECLGLRRTR
jgi:hypothetical protein